MLWYSTNRNDWYGTNRNDWYVYAGICSIAHSFNITKADSIGLIDSPYTHIEYWITLQEKYSELQNYEYEQIPRGRVIFDTNKEKSIIYLDKTLLYKSKINKVYDFFNLNPEQSVLKKDSHYQI